MSDISHEKNEIVEILKRLKHEAFIHYKAKLTGIFGSYGRNKANENSDVDILVEFQKGATLLELSGLANFLEDKLQCKVDIVSQRAIREEIKSYIYKDMVYL
jgi:predicted nucleotidyltransferase